MATFNYPFHITKDTPAVAAESQTNFDGLLAWLLANLVQKDGSIAMTGPLVLAPGPPAAPDQAANKAYVDATMPVGMVVEYAGTTLPTGWLWCNGDTYSNTAQPMLVAAIGRTYTAVGVPATSFQVPDMRKRSPVGADATEAAAYGLGVKGGQRNSELQAHTHNVPAHGHTATGSTGAAGAHGHSVSVSGTTDPAGAHSHNIGAGTQLYWVQPGQPEGFIAGGSAGRSGAWQDAPNHTHTFSGGGSAAGVGDHGHTVGVTVNNAGALTTDSVGAGTTLVDKNLSPYLVMNFIIFAGSM